MFSLKVENEKGEVLAFNEEKKYQIVKITGLNPPAAVITTGTRAGKDGTIAKSSRLGNRNIVIYIRINGDVEDNRNELYRYFRTKHYVKVFYKNGIKNVCAEGIVETIECDLFTNSETMQVSILCADPYLYDVDATITDVSKHVPLFEFPFEMKEPRELSRLERDRIATVINAGDETTGLIIELVARDIVANPRLYRVESNEVIALDVTMLPGDKIVINTQSGKRCISKVSESGDTTNFMRYLNNCSNWIQAESGENNIAYEAEQGTENLDVTITFRKRYEGV